MREAEKKNEDLSEMLQYIAVRMDETEQNAMYWAVRYFFLKVKEEELRRDIYKICPPLR
jgi:hypothetical protein